MPTLYTVRPGDTLSSIARKYGCEVASLQSANRIGDPKRLQAGAVLQIPTTRLRSETQRPTDKTLTPGSTPPNDRRGSSAPSWSLGSLWEDLSGEAGEAWAKGVWLFNELSTDVLRWYREVESTENIIAADQTALAKRKPGEQKKHKSTAPKSASPGRKHKDEVIAKLRERLYAVPHVVSTSGVRLSRNERRMIVAAVGLCEIDNHVFGSRNLDYEFVGRRFGRRGIETGYSRIVHIGLSYGYIQYTQDGGGLGRVLQRMREKDKKSFDEVFFPNAEQLIQMTTTGLPGKDKYGASGQKYWRDLTKKERSELQKRANTDENKDGKPDDPLSADEEIRGARVQKIAYVPGYPAIDLWEDYKEIPTLPGTRRKATYQGYLSAFKAAGDVPAFQDAQIELAVEDYLNPMLAHCRQWNIRSALGLAFVVACSVRGGPGSDLSRLFTRVAAAKLSIEKFDTAKQELECLQAIADAKGSSCDVAGVKFHGDEARRAKLILKDQYDFLKEDFYDPQTYDSANDK